MISNTNTAPESVAEPKPEPKTAGSPASQERGGPKGLEPTRYGDWERKGKCVDF